MAANCVKFVGVNKWFGEGAVCDMIAGNASCILLNEFDFAKTFNSLYNRQTLTHTIS